MADKTVEQSMCRGDIVALCSLGRRVWQDEHRPDDWVSESERSLIGRLLAPLWGSLGEIRQDEIREVIATELDDPEFAHGGGFDSMLRDSKLRLWLSAQNDVSLANALDYLVTGSPPVTEVKR